MPKQQYSWILVREGYDHMGKEVGWVLTIWYPLCVYAKMEDAVTAAKESAEKEGKRLGFLTREHGSQSEGEYRIWLDRPKDNLDGYNVWVAKRVLTIGWRKPTK